MIAAIQATREAGVRSGRVIARSTVSRWMTNPPAAMTAPTRSSDAPLILAPHAHLRSAADATRLWATWALALRRPETISPEQNGSATSPGRGGLVAAIASFLGEPGGHEVRGTAMKGGGKRKPVPAYSRQARRRRPVAGCRLAAASGRRVRPRGARPPPAGGANQSP